MGKYSRTVVLPNLIGSHHYMRLPWEHLICVEYFVDGNASDATSRVCDRKLGPDIDGVTLNYTVSEIIRNGRHQTLVTTTDVRILSDGLSDDSYDEYLNSIGKAAGSAWRVQCNEYLITGLFASTSMMLAWFTRRHVHCFKKPVQGWQERQELDCRFLH